MKRLVLFNHKGGVSKTTTTLNLGWMLAELGQRVLLVDADPQCNLSGLILGLAGEGRFEAFYREETTRNIRAGLAPAFESQPRAIEAVECVEVGGREGLFLLPGHIRLSEYETTLGIAQELSGSIQTLQNLPGAPSALLDATATGLGVDILLIDMNPSLSSMNQNLLMTSDYFIVPTSPDYFSVMALDSLSAILPRWRRWASRAQENAMLAAATYPFPERNPRFLGTIIQKFRPRGGEPTRGFQRWIDAINEKVQRDLLPALAAEGMVLDEEVYTQVADLGPGYCLAQIADFNTLIAKSQEHRTPVFALTDGQLESVGTVLQTDQAKRQEFHDSFNRLANAVLTLMAADEAN